MSSIYVHIPFCRKACHYCDFHFSTSFKTYEDVVSGIQSELNYWSDAWEPPVETIYFGGGTPSTLKAEDLSGILQTIRSRYRVSPAAEVTLEANPEDITPSLLNAWRESGVNRLSMGVQSFFEDELTWMNRNHSADKSRSSIQLAQQAGFDNITIDLIYGLPVSNFQRWKDNVEGAIDTGVPHISAYALTVEDRTALAHQIEKGKTKAPVDEEAHEQFHFLRKALMNADFEHYEISNFAKEGWRSVHNGNYWKGIPYLGIGPGAHGFDGELRRVNVSNNAIYAKSLKNGESWYETEKLAVQDRYNELVMTHLRRVEGISLEEVAVRFGSSYKDHLVRSAKLPLAQELLAWDGDWLRLTEKGLFLADGITIDLMKA